MKHAFIAFAVLMSQTALAASYNANDPAMAPRAAVARSSASSKACPAAHMAQGTTADGKLVRAGFSQDTRTEAAKRFRGNGIS